MRDDLGDAQGVIGPDFYLHHASQDICEAMAALLNGYTERAAQIVERWRA